MILDHAILLVSPQELKKSKQKSKESISLCPLLPATTDGNEMIKLEQPPKTQVEATKRDGRFTFSAPEKTSYLFTLSGEKQNSINILLKL